MDVVAWPPWGFASVRSAGYSTAVQVLYPPCRRKPAPAAVTYGHIAHFTRAGNLKICLNETDAVYGHTCGQRVLLRGGACYVLHPSSDAEAAPGAEWTLKAGQYIMLGGEAGPTQAARPGQPSRVAVWDMQHAVHEVDMAPGVQRRIKSHL